MAVRTLRTVIARYAALVVGLPFLLMLLLGFIWLAPQIRRELDEHQRQIAVAVATQVESYLANSRTAVVSLASLLPEGESADHASRVQRILDTSVANLKMLQACYLVDKDGRIEAIALPGGRNRQQDLVGMNLSSNKLVRTALRDKKEHWSDSYLSLVGGGISVALAVPQGERVLVAELELGHLSHYLEKVSTVSQKIFVLDRRGQVVADREGSYTAQQLNLSNLPLVQQWLEGGRLTSDTFSFEGSRMVGGLFQIPEISWSVLVAQRWEDVNRSLLTSGRIVAVGLLSAALLLSGLIFFFTRLLVRRFEQLAGHARLVAGSPEEVPWPKYSITEFNSLAESLSGMARKLRERAALLQEEVSEREHAEESLRERNEELAAAEEELRQQLEELFLAQEQLLRSEEAYRTVAEWTYDWEYWLSPEGRFLYVSPSCERVTGYPVQAFLDEADLMVRIIQPEFREAMQRHLKACAAPMGEGEEEPTSFVFSLEARDGSTVWIEHSCREVFSEEGRYLGRRASNRDVTERRILEQQVLQQQKLEGIGLLAGGIAHDFNNMLLPILACAEMIEAGCGDETLKKRAAMIKEAGTRAKELVRQLLTFGHKQELQTRLYDLNEIVESFVTMLRRTIREDICITSRLSAAPCRILADRTQVEQVLLNLAVNASDAIEGHGTITLETSPLVFEEEFCRLHPGTSPGRYVMLCFSDTGGGMDDTTLAHVFEPFFTTKPVGKGTGLGLSTSYGIIKRHGGTVDVHSAPGRGTSFRIYLPQEEADGTAQERHNLSAQPESAGDATILVVEDNALVLEMVREILEKQGYRVLATPLPEEAIELARNSQIAIDLLVSDVVMPQMSGPELCGRLVELRPELRTLFMSGYASATVVHKGLLQEGVNVIAKPFTSEALLKKVDEFLGRPAAD